MDLNLNIIEQIQPNYPGQKCRLPDTAKLLTHNSKYFNISNFQYNIITNRQKLDKTSLSKLVADETGANKFKTFLCYWNNENFFDPIRNSKDKFDNNFTMKAANRKRIDFDTTKYAKAVSLPVIKVLAVNKIQHKK